MSDEGGAQKHEGPKAGSRAGGVRPHRQLILWQKAVDLVTAVYGATRRFPADERFGLTGQLRRAAVSIPSNVAEGAARRTRSEYQQYRFMARGSLNELDTQIEIARRLGYLTTDEAAERQNQIEEASRLLSGLLRYVTGRRNA